MKFIFITCCLLYLNISVAQVNWESMPVPNENVSSLTTSSTNTIYLGTFTYGVFRSVNDAVSWTDISAGLGDSTISQMQTSSDDKLFAATASHGIYLYEAGSWVSINSGLPATNSTVVSFAKALNGGMYVMLSTGKIYSWAGNAWTDITYNFPAQGRALAVGPDGSLYAGAFNSGVYKYNNSNSWSIVGNAMPNSFITKITVTAADVIYVACNSNNVYRCGATGGSWSAANTGLPVANMNFIISDASNNLFIAPNVALGVLYRLQNGSSVWSIVSGGMFTTTFNCMAVAPSGVAYAGASGVFRTNDGGNNWSDMNPGLHAPKAITCFTCTKNGVMFLGTRYGPWRSIDNGTTWQLRNTGVAHLVTLQIMENAAGNILFHAINNTPKGAIYRSTDNGDSWIQVAANGTDMYTKLKQHKTDTIWATSRFSGATSLSYSINNGATWINNPLTVSAIWDIDVSKENTIFLGSESEGVSRSDNGGQSFTTGVGNTIPWYGNVIEIETDANGTIMAGTDWWTHALWFSTAAENGNNWTEFTDPDLVINGVQDLVFDKNNNAYVAAENGGVVMAYNNAWNASTNWIKSSAGLPSPNTDVLELGFDITGYLYAVSYTSNGHSGGLFRTTMPVNPPTSTTYTFMGNGNWNSVANWSNNVVPPSTLSGNNLMIVIDPLLNGECILNVPQKIINGAMLKISANKKFKILSRCNIYP